MHPPTLIRGTGRVSSSETLRFLGQLLVGFIRVTGRDGIRAINEVPALGL
jgi:hypothetical protein